MSGGRDLPISLSDPYPIPMPRQPQRPPIWDRFEHLSSAVLRITAERDLKRVLQQIADSAREVIGCKYAALGVLDVEGIRLERFVASGISDEEYRRIGELPKGRGILGVLIKDPKPLRLRELTNHAKSFGFPPHHPRMHTFLGVPIMGRDRAIGNLYLTEKLGRREFTEQDETLAVMLAAHAAVAVENARVHTEREALIAQLRTLQISRDRFFAMINHELRNALTAVYGWAELWMRKEGPDVPRHAREVFESAQRALTLLEDLLDLSRLEANRLQLRPRDVDLRDVVGEAIRSVEPAADARRVTLATEGLDKTIRCRTDPQRVRQIMINLLTNAVRHSPEGDTVTVKAESRDRRIRISVTDRGEGLSKEQQATIFEAFEPAGAETERGTGLGLTLSRKLAHLMDGDLEVESTLGEGSRFTLDLPKEVS